ncbi:hypothetical protein OSTOST_11582, partial [Ostertagia ostertagi]
TIHLIQYFTYDPCHIGLSPILCYSLRYPIASCMVSFAAFQVAMVVERGVALWKRHDYESYGPNLAIGATALCIAVSLMAMLIVTHGATQTLPTNYCILNGIATPQSVIVLKLTICGFDLLTLIGIATLFLLNRSLSKRKAYDLKSSYQLLENRTVIRIILPLAIFQTLFYISFAISGAVVSLLHRDLEKVLYVTLTSFTYVSLCFTYMRYRFKCRRQNISV